MSIKINHSQTTHRGNHREQNEDSCAIQETRNGQLFVTCDGMGGAAEGKKASSIGVKSIVEFFEKEEFDNIQIALFQSLKFANEQIYATAQLNPAFKGMGTTACVVLFQKDEMYFAHVGDSRIYLHTDGKLKHLTRDHSFVNQLVDQGTLRPNEAKNHPEKNRILKALGVHLDLEPTVANQPVLLKKGDQVLLCSDGLTDMVSDPGIEAVLNQEKSVPEKTQTLLQKALDNGGKDNITVQLIEVAQSPHTATIFVDKTPKDLSTTLIDAEEVSGERKKGFSKKYFLIAIPVLLFLLWGMMSQFNNNEDKDGLEQNAEVERNDEISSDSISEIKGIQFSAEKNNPNLTKTKDSQEKEEDEEKRVLRESKEKGNKGMQTMPDYVKINYSHFDNESIFQTVGDILKKFPSLTEQKILTINEKENTTDFKSGEKVYLDKTVYDSLHSKLNSNQSANKDMGSALNTMWKTKPTFVILDKIKGNDELSRTVKSIYEIPKLIEISKESLQQINKVENFWDLDTLKIIYLTKERIGPN
jgi:protein phosphatase